MNHNAIFDDVKDNLLGLTQDHKDLCYGLGEYVNATCGSRDESHGYEHMKQVAKNSLLIFSKMQDNIQFTNMSKANFISLLLACSWLHDVSDKKYDLDGSLKINLTAFLESMFGTNVTTLILDIMIRTSYSFETAMIANEGKVDWEEKLGADEVILRNIVSDADKIEAIGYQGVVRCMTYNIELLKKSNTDISFDNLIDQVKKHATDKLLKLKDNYIKTSFGKEIAVLLHNEMIEIFNDNNKLVEIYDLITKKNIKE